jgi:hypothetical protein
MEQSKSDIIDFIALLSGLNIHQAEVVVNYMEKDTVGAISRITNLTKFFLVNYNCYVIEADVKYGDATQSREFYVDMSLIRSLKETTETTASTSF